MWRKNITAVIALSLLCSACDTAKKSYIEIGKYPAPIKEQENTHLPVVYVSFIFTTDSTQAREFDNSAQMLKEIQILNQHFVDENNQQIFRFKPYRYYSHENFIKRKCGLANQLNQTRVLDSDRIPALVQDCFSHRKSKEILFFIYDAYSEKLKYKDVTSWGYQNQGQPFILIDWKRLNYKIQSATPHEMGHAFGLKHVCSPDAKINSPTNIMSSYDCKQGSGGLRNIGFNQTQYSTIIQNYKLLK